MQPNQAFSTITISLLKGVIYKEESLDIWKALIRMRLDIEDFVGKIGLELAIDEPEGYAFLRSRDDMEDTPRLVTRQQYSYDVSLLLCLLRKKMAQSDAAGNPRTVVSLGDVVDMAKVFYPAVNDETELDRKVEKALRDILKMGFIRKMRGRENEYEVRRIVKAYVDAQCLSGYEQMLALYKENVATEEEADA